MCWGTRRRIRHGVKHLGVEILGALLNVRRQHIAVLFGSRSSGRMR